jgi:ATP-dependent Lon protease
VPIEVRLVLLGDLTLYRKLETTDPDFRDLFKVLVVLESTQPRDPESVQRYAGLVARLARNDSLPPFERGALRSLVEAGARLADRPDELSTRFDLIEDIAREGAYLARRRRAPSVERDDVEQAMQRILRRSDPPARRYRYLLRCGRFNVRTSGLEVGQVNGLALMRSTQLPYGIPARLTATVGPGTAGIVDIENEAGFGGNIHTKGFHIFGGVLRRLLQADHPLVLSASVAFEQSYGRIDGDSASAAEACCLLSALAGVPVRQGLAMTGSIDQLGNIQAVGGCNEKVEGFYDACVETGLTGDQGVIVPRSNLGDLMLRPDLVAACERGEFHLYAVTRLEEALELFTGMPAGTRRSDGAFPEDTVLGRAAARARELWVQSTRRQPKPTAAVESE